MKISKSTSKVTARQRRLLELQVREYIERYHPEMANTVIQISPDGLTARVAVEPADNRARPARNRKKEKP